MRTWKRDELRGNISTVLRTCRCFLLSMVATCGKPSLIARTLYRTATLYC
jgi:hypothetical protein